ncbi:MAG: hypothetical protein KGH89_02200 [Thaumarchaeota archaeon]|nr:hypothetical protein [Nitrososphaerota archaeon]
MNEKLIQQEEGCARQIKNENLNKMVPILVLSALAVMFISGNLGFAWADTGVNTNNVAIKATDAIKNDPVTMNVLQKIELFKQQYATQQQAQQLQDQQDQFIKQQRTLANEYLQNDLARMSDNNSTSPQNAFASFASTVNSPTQGVFLDEFNYMQAKVQQAIDAKDQILQNGGTFDQAVQAFNNAATFHKTELVSVNNHLNVKYSLADQKVQSLFDQWGNIPRN